MQQLLLRVWEREKKTLLFVTHDIDEAILLGNWIYVMSGRPGRIREKIHVPIKRPRTLDMVMSPAFIDVKRRIVNLLHDEMKDQFACP